MDLEYSSTVVSQAGFVPYPEKHLVSILDRMQLFRLVWLEKKGSLN